jgi:hypothetical protein
VIIYEVHVRTRGANYRFRCFVGLLGEDGVVESRPLRGRSAGSDETLVDVAPSPLRPRLQARGERVVGLLVVRPGVPVR